jgi:hypothetical protein
MGYVNNTVYFFTTLSEKHFIFLCPSSSTADFYLNSPFPSSIPSILHNTYSRPTAWQFSGTAPRTTLGTTFRSVSAPLRPRSVHTTVHSDRRNSSWRYPTPGWAYAPTEHPLYLLQQLTTLDNLTKLSQETNTKSTEDMMRMDAIFEGRRSTI